MLLRLRRSLVLAVALGCLIGTSAGKEPRTAQRDRANAQTRITKPHKMPPLRFGTGKDGPLRLEQGVFLTDQVRTPVLGAFAEGSEAIDVATTDGFEVGDLILLHQARGSNRGDWEFNRVRGIESHQLMLETPSSTPFREGGELQRSQAQIIRVPQYSDCYIGADVDATASEWDQDTGGVVVLVCSGETVIDGRVTASGLGFNGGKHVHFPDWDCAFSGESSMAASLRVAIPQGNGGGGGGGRPDGSCNGTGPAGGGGHGTRGDNSSVGVGGGMDGNDTFDGMLFGGGGGGPKTHSGTSLHENVRGGNGGGAVLIFAQRIGGSGRIDADGAQAIGYAEESDRRQPFSGGGGAGGGIFITADRGTLEDVTLSAVGGPKLVVPGGIERDSGGAGGDGRIRVEYCSFVPVASKPEAVRERIVCSTPPSPTPAPTPTSTPITRNPCEAPIALVPGVTAYGQVYGPNDHLTFAFQVEDAFTDVRLRLRDRDDRLGARAVRACSDAGTGTGRHIGTGSGRQVGMDRILEFNVGTETGTYFVDVSSSGTAGAYPVDVEINLDLQSDTASRRTLILTDERLLFQLHGLTPTSQEAVAWREAVNRFANHDTVRGTIIWNVRTDTNTEISNAYLRWRSDATNTAAANTVAQQISSWLWSMLAGQLKGIRYIVLLGDDRVIPHQRLPIGVESVSADSRWQLEQFYGDTGVLDSQSTIGSAILDGMTLSDDVYGSPLAAIGAESIGLRIPLLPVGRLVERPEHMTTVIAAFLDNNGMLAVNDTMVAGYDFMEDGAAAADAVYAAAGIDLSHRIRLLGSSWTGASLIEGLNRRLDLMTIAAHSTHFLHRAPDGSTVSSESLPASSTNYAGAIVSTLACHGALSAPGAQPQPLDHPEAWQSRGAMLVGSTGWAYGMQDVLAYQEQLLTDMNARLVTGQGRSIGDALLSAKQTYFTTHELTHYDAKTIAGTVLYGLPMFRTRIAESSTPAASVAVSDVGRGARSLGANSPNVRRVVMSSTGSATQLVSTTIVVNTADLKRVDLTDGSYYRFGERVPLASSGQPIEPVITQDLPDIDRDGQRLALHGVLFAGGRYETDPSFRFLTAQAGVLNGDVPSRITDNGAPFTGLAVPVSLRRPYRYDPNDGTMPPSGGIWYVGQVVGGVHRLYKTIDTAELYSDSTDWEAPTIRSIRTDTSAVPHGRLHAILAPGSDARTVLATCDHLDGSWTIHPFTAVQPEEWSVVVPPASACIVQAVDGAGNVAIDHNAGAYYRMRSTPSPTYLPAVLRSDDAFGSAAQR